MSNLMEIQSKIEALRKQAESIRTKDFAATVKEIREKMAAFGITVKDIQGSAKASGKAKNGVVSKVKSAKKSKGPMAGIKVEAKYKGPNGETWTGRGLAPKWLSTLIAQGRSKDEFAISSSSASTAG